MKSSPQTILCATVRSDIGSDNISPAQCPSISTPSSIGSSFSKMTSISGPFSDLLEASVSGSDVPVTSIPPFLCSVRDPITIKSESELKSLLEELSVSLATTEDAWDKRMESLTSLERLIAGGSIGRFHANANSNLSIVNFFRKMPIEAQIEDLRSLLTGQACKVVAALAYTLGDDFAPLAEKWIPSILRLSISGVRVMAQQGMNCVMQITSFPGFGHPRLIPLFLDGCMSKQHQNYKRSCILALTNALRVWGCQPMLEKHLRVISKAILAAASDRDPNVREDGRKGFWALHDRFETSAIEMLGLVDRGLRKRLELAKQEANLEWKDGGNMNLISRGYDVSMVLSQQDNSAIACSRGVGSSYTIGTRTPLFKNSGGITRSALKAQKPSLNAAIPDHTWKSKSCTTSSRQDVPNFTAKTIKKKTAKLPMATVEAVQPVPMPKPNQNLNLAIRSKHSRRLTCTKKGNSRLDIENLAMTPVKTAPSVASEQDGPQCILKPSSSAPNEVYNLNAFPIDILDKMTSNKKATTDSTQVEQDMADFPPSFVISTENLPVSLRYEPEQLSSESYTLSSFLNEVSDPDWSVRERALSLVTSSFSSVGVPDKNVDIDSFISAEVILQRQFILSLVKNINDTNLCVSMSSLEAVNSILLNKRGNRMLHNSLHLLLLAMLNKSIPSTNDETDVATFRLVDDFLNSLQLCMSAPSSLECLMVAIIELMYPENLAQLSDGAQLRLHDLVCLFIPHAKVFLEEGNNLKSIIEVSVGLASVVSPLSLSVALKPIIYSICQAIGNHAVISELSKVNSGDLLTAFDSLDEEWTRTAHLKSVKPSGNTTAPTTAISYDDNFEPNMVVEQIDSISQKICPPIKSDSLVESVSEDQHPIDNQQNVGKANFISRSPLDNVNRSTLALELVEAKFQSPDSDSVLRYLSRPTPISAVKYCTDSIDTEIDFILRELNNCRLSQDLYLAMQSVLQLARDDEFCAVWDKHFVEILRSILKGTIDIPARRLSQSTADVAEARHLYLQGLRVLIKFHSQRFEDFVDEVVKTMILCSNDVNSYIVHASNRVLESLISTQNPSSCFAAILPHLEYPAQGVHDDLDFSLSALRVTTKLVRRLDPEVVKKALPTLYPPLLLSIADDSVEIRKATVFLIVEMMLLFDDTGYPPLPLDQLTLPQRRLVFYFANRRRK